MENDAATRTGDPIEVKSTHGLVILKDQKSEAGTKNSSLKDQTDTVSHELRENASNKFT